MTFRFRYAGKVDHEEDLLVDGAYSLLIRPIFNDVPDVEVDHRKLRTRRIGNCGESLPEPPLNFSLSLRLAWGIFPFPYFVDILRTDRCWETTEL